MLWIISVAVSLFWVLGTATAVTFGGLLHVVFAVTILWVLCVRFAGRRVAAAPTSSRESERVIGRMFTPGRRR